MTREQRLEAEAWYRALREWRTREFHESSPSIRVRPGGAPPRYVRGCPVCRSLRGGEYDDALLAARAMGRDERPLIARIARELGVREELVARHASEHISLEPPPTLVGEWSRRPRIRLGRHVFTPIGWVPEERLVRAIREAPEKYRALLDRVRFGRGPRSLLDRRWAAAWKSAESEPMARAILWLAARLDRVLQPVEDAP